MTSQAATHERPDEQMPMSQRPLAEAQRIAGLGYWEWDIPADLITWSDELYRIYGLNPAEFEASFEAFLSRVHPADRPRVQGIIEDAFQNANEFEFEHRIIRPDDVVRTLQAKGSVIRQADGSPVRMVGTGMDITDRKQIEDELQTRTTLLESVIQGAPIILWSLDEEGKITLMGGQGLEGTGLSPDHYLGTSVYDHIAEQPEIADYIRRAQSGEVVTANVESDGLIFESRYAPMKDVKGEIIGVTGISFDVTPRVKAERARRESEARFRTIFEGAGIGIAILDLDGRIQVSNAALQGMVGYSYEELGTKTLWELIQPDELEASREAILPMFSGELELIRREERLVRSDGGRAWANLTLSLVRGPEEAPRFAIAMVEDITARKEMEAELAEVHRQLVASREKERLHLAQEIHDEPLQDLYGLLYQLNAVRAEESSAEKQTELAAMEQDLNRVINTLRALCGEMRPPALAPFGLEGALREQAEQFEETHPEYEVNLDLMYDGQTLPEHIRLTLFRIFQHALRNVARHAHAKTVTVRFRFDDEDATLEIEDDGVGFELPERWVEWVREDHFGLVGSMERVEMVDGRMEIITAPGEGTLIRAVVPRSSG